MRLGSPLWFPSRTWSASERVWLRGSEIGRTGHRAAPRILIFGTHGGSLAWWHPHPNSRWATRPAGSVLRVVGCPVAEVLSHRLVKTLSRPCGFHENPTTAGLSAGQLGDCRSREAHEVLGRHLYLQTALADADIHRLVPLGGGVREGAKPLPLVASRFTALNLGFTLSSQTACCFAHGGSQ